MARRFAKSAGQQDQALCIGPRARGAGGYAQKNPLTLARRRRSRACQLCIALPPAAAPLPLRIRHRHGGRACAPHTSIRRVRVPYSQGATPLLPCAAAEGGRLKGAKGPAAPMPPSPGTARSGLRVPGCPGNGKGGDQEGRFAQTPSREYNPSTGRSPGGKQEKPPRQRRRSVFFFFCRRRPRPCIPRAPGAARGAAQGRKCPMRRHAWWRRGRHHAHAGRGARAAIAGDAAAATPPARGAGPPPGRAYLRNPPHSPAAGRTGRAARRPCAGPRRAVGAGRPDGGAGAAWDTSAASAGAAAAPPPRPHPPRASRRSAP